MSTSDALAAFAERLGHQFGDAALLARALRHRSWCAEHPGHDSNERLEFLGDAVLGLIVAEHVYHEFADRDEGWLSRARSSVVRAGALAEMALELDLGPIVQLGKGEHTSGGREKVSILADSLEAVLGAVYLDGGWDAVRPVVRALIAERLGDLARGSGDQDDKSRLQELVARRFDRPPIYRVEEQGPEHDKRFTARVHVDGRLTGVGSGRSKKQAEQAAARAAWQCLDADRAGSPETGTDTAPVTTPNDRTSGHGPARTIETLDA